MTKTCCQARLSSQVIICKFLTSPVVFCWCILKHYSRNGNSFALIRYLVNKEFQNCKPQYLQSKMLHTIQGACSQNSAHYVEIREMQKATKNDVTMLQTNDENKNRISGEYLSM
jgi:hypothetical protein